MFRAAAARTTRPRQVATFLSLSCLAFSASAQSGLSSDDWRSGLRKDLAGAGSAVVLHCAPPEPGEFGNVAYLSPEGLEAHLVDLANPETELVFPVGEFIQPPPGLYRFWLEGDGRMSPHAALLPRISADFSGLRSLGCLPTVPSGSLRLGVGASAFGGGPLQLLYLGEEADEGYVPIPLRLRFSAGEASEGVQMPVGRSVVLAGGIKDQPLRSISKPIVVSRGRVAEIRFADADKSHLMVRAIRTRGAAIDERPLLDAKLHVSGAPVPAAATLETSEEVFAFWYDLPRQSATVELKVGDQFVEGLVGLRPEEVAVLEQRLAPRPSLNLSLSLPPSFPDATVGVRILAEVDGRAIAEERISRQQLQLLLRDMPRERLRIEATFSTGSKTHTVDLSSGNHASIVIEPPPPEIERSAPNGGPA